MSKFIEIDKDKIPNWLKHSNIVKIFNEDSDENYIIPSNKFEKEIIILNINDLYKYLEICRYWMIDNYPFEIYDYIINNINKINYYEIRENFYDMTIIDEFLILTSQIRYTKTLNASEKGYLNLLIYLTENNYPLTIDTCSAAAKNGKIECLKYLINNNCPYDEDNICLDAVKNNNLDCLKFLHKKGFKFPQDIYYYPIKKGYLDCLKFIFETGFPAPIKICFIAVSYGQLECLIYLHNNGFLMDEDLCLEAANYGHLNCLKYIINNCPNLIKNNNICLAAIDSIDCLKYLHEVIGFKLHELTCSIAAYNSNLNILKYGHENGCSLNGISLDSSMYNNLECLEYIIKYINK